MNERQKEGREVADARGVGVVWGRVVRYELFNLLSGVARPVNRYDYLKVMRVGKYTKALVHMDHSKVRERISILLECHPDHRF